MKRLSFFGTLVFIALSLGCSSPEKSTTETKPVEPLAQEAASGLSKDDILGKYSLNQLNAAANALTVIADEAKASKGERSGVDVLGCEMKEDVARRRLTRVRDLIIEKTRDERLIYVDDPNKYSREHAFETCGSTCSCGAYAAILEPVDVKTLKGQYQKTHAKFLLRLQAKAAHQGPRETLMCAQKQTWLCEGELTAYLDGR